VNSKSAIILGCLLLSAQALAEESGPTAEDERLVESLWKDAQAGKTADVLARLDERLLAGHKAVSGRLGYLRTLSVVVGGGEIREADIDRQRHLSVTLRVREAEAAEQRFAEAAFWLLGGAEADQRGRKDIAEVLRRGHGWSSIDVLVGNRASSAAEIFLRDVKTDKQVNLRKGGERFEAFLPAGTYEVSVVASPQWLQLPAGVEGPKQESLTARWLPAGRLEIAPLKIARQTVRAPCAVVVAPEPGQIVHKDRLAALEWDGTLAEGESFRVTLSRFRRSDRIERPTTLNVVWSATTKERRAEVGAADGPKRLAPGLYELEVAVYPKGSNETANYSSVIFKVVDP
jgi:hypothetical protein